MRPTFCKLTLPPPADEGGSLPTPRRPTSMSILQICACPTWSRVKRAASLSGLLEWRSGTASRVLPTLGKTSTSQSVGGQDQPIERAASTYLTRELGAGCPRY